jgi:AraC family transcriptional regulator of adaptative response/methylated-DNA-[protein]-cysteine methyltransferase
MTEGTPLMNSYSTDDARWRAVADRDPEADGAFVYAVATTGIYCRPGCPARLPKRENVRFFDTIAEAESAGFRPCMRCAPDAGSLKERHVDAVARACRMIEEAELSISLAALAAAVGISPHHFHRIFKAQTGVTPRAYFAAHRGRRVRDQLGRADSVTEAIYEAGFNANSRFYEGSNDMLGMTPTAFRAGGAGETIRFAIGQSTLGALLVAATEKGICAIFLGDDPDRLARDLQDAFPKAEITGDDKDFDAMVAQVVGFVERPAIGLDLPLDIRGTAFQRQVWEALQSVPPGMTASYTDIARQIGQPKSVRAVATACAANKIAVAIPCHRIVRTDGSLSGYRWGVERKGELLQREQEGR